VTRAARRRAALAAMLLIGASAGVQAQAPAARCGERIAGAQRIEGPRDVVAFAPRPAPWALGKHFAIEFEVCPKAGEALPEQVRVDARMPEHGHGMNYRTSLQAQGPGRWRADGLLLHMAGRWELGFELRRAERVERLTHDLHLR
jgi:hypothetical protein